METTEKTVQSTFKHLNKYVIRNNEGEYFYIKTIGYKQALTFSEKPSNAMYTYNYEMMDLVLQKIQDIFGDLNLYIETISENDSRYDSIIKLHYVYEENHNSVKSSDTSTHTLLIPLSNSPSKRSKKVTSI